MHRETGNFDKLVSITTDNMHAKVEAFKAKLQLIYAGMNKGNCDHMHTLKQTSVCGDKLGYYASKL